MTMEGQQNVLDSRVLHRLMSSITDAADVPFDAGLDVLQGKACLGSTL